MELGEGKETGTKLAQGLPTGEQERKLYKACQKALVIFEAAVQNLDKNAVIDYLSLKTSCLQILCQIRKLLILCMIQRDLDI